jgi:hypothetical protein
MISTSIVDTFRSMAEERRAGELKEVVFDRVVIVKRGI